MLTSIEIFERHTQMLEMFNGDKLVQSIREMAESAKRCAAALKAVRSALSDGLTHGKRGAEVNERLPGVAALPPRASRSASISASALATAH